jgi:hypothetical protein
MIDEDTEQSEEEEKPKAAIPWLSGPDAFLKYGYNVRELKALVHSKKVRKKILNGRDVYSIEDLEKLEEGSGEENPQAVLAELLRAARDMVAVAQKHDEVKFDKYQIAQDKLFTSLLGQIEKQNDHILELEKQAMQMREATEKVFNLEHERKMGELREERTRSMQAKALEMLQKTLGPWAAAKLGGVVPGVQASSGDAPDPRFTQLGQAVVGMIGGMSDEKFGALEGIIPPEEYMVLQAIREGLKQ